MDETVHSENTSAVAPRQLITIEEAARRIGRQKKTLQNWIYNGTLRGENGLCYVGPPDHRRPMIDWHLFAQAFIQRAA
jgi:hypothetical protein